MLSRLLSNPLVIITVAFQLWMLVDAIRQREWLWALFVLAFPGLGSLWYFFNVYRHSGSLSDGFELPGAHDRRRIKELQAQIHHLDKAHHHAQLGDIYFQQGKFEQARQCYEASLERDREDRDTQAHYGQCLLRLNRPTEARSILEAVTKEEPKHDYGYTLMALAETLSALGETEAAIQTWRRVTSEHSYARARVQLAELLYRQKQNDEARAILTEVLTDDRHNPVFQRRKDRPWIKRAQALIGQV